MFRSNCIHDIARHDQALPSYDGKHNKLQRDYELRPRQRHFDTQTIPIAPDSDADPENIQKLNYGRHRDSQMTRLLLDSYSGRGR